MDSSTRQFGKGARLINPIRLAIHKMARPKIGKAVVPFDWEKGYDVREHIGPIKVKDQGGSSSCGGQAGAYFLEIQERLRGLRGRDDGIMSAKSIYAPIAYMGGGTTVVALMTQLGSAGALFEPKLPSYYVDGVTPLSEAMFIEKSWMTDATDKEAIRHAGYTPYDIGENMEVIAQTIRDYGGAIWMIAGQDNGTWLSAYPKPPQKGGGEIWHHFMILVGAKAVDGVKTIFAINSWGTDVGLGGEQRFQQDYFDAKGITDAFTFIHDGKPLPASSFSLIWRAIREWFRSLPA